MGGIDISDTIFKVSQYCDDTTLFVKDSDSAKYAIDVVKEFGCRSGLQLNIDKCDFMWLGGRKQSKESICGREPVSRMKILGVWFSAIENCDNLNLEVAGSKIKRTVENWARRDLTIKGKITVAKSLLVSQLVYLMTTNRIEEKSLAKIQSHIMKFVWRGRPPKVARKTIIMPIESGGLALPDVMASYRANRIAWIRRLAKLQDSAFVKVLQKRLRIKMADLVKTKMDDRWIKRRIVPEFYKEIIAWLNEINIINEPDSAQLIRQQPIWHNAWVNVQGSSLAYREDVEKRLTMIDDIVDNFGNILTYQNYMDSNADVRINLLMYGTYVCAEGYRGL